MEHPKDIRQDVPVTNRGKMPIYVAGAMVLPGETRIFPAHHVPPHLRPSAEAQTIAPADPVLDLLDENVPDIVAALQARDEAGGPLIDDAALDRIEAAEENGKTRKGVLHALAEERLRRADEREEAGQGDGGPPAGNGPPAD